MLNVTAGHVELALKNLAEHDEPELSALSDEQLWERLDSAIYRRNKRTTEQVVADDRRYRRFDFLTNGGESFDNFKSFFVADDHDVRVLFKSDDQPLIGRRVDRSVFIETLQAWLQWFKCERARLKNEKQ